MKIQPAARGARDDRVLVLAACSCGASPSTKAGANVDPASLLGKVIAAGKIRISTDAELRAVLVL